MRCGSDHQVRSEFRRDSGSGSESTGQTDVRGTVGKELALAVNANGKAALLGCMSRKQPDAVIKGTAAFL